MSLLRAVVVRLAGWDLLSVRSQSSAAMDRENSVIQQTVRAAFVLALMSEQQIV